jgi:putative transposase
MSDALSDGWAIHTFNVLDDFNREALSIEVELSLPSARVTRSLEQVIEWRGNPNPYVVITGQNILVRH